MPAEAGMQKSRAWLGCILKTLENNKVIKADLLQALRALYTQILDKKF